jgi:hypothetical protein
MDQALGTMLKDLNGLVNLWRQTEDIQWQRSRSRVSGDDPGIRQRGGHSDPTGDTTADPRRLNVRHQRKRAVKELDRIAATMGTLRHDLERAVEEWG